MKITPLITITAAIAAWFFPWWSVVIAAGIIGLIANPKTSALAYAAGFAGVGLAWSAYALFLNFQNQGLLAGKIATIFHLPNSTTLISVTILIGSLLGGFGCMTGALLRKIFEK